MFTGLVEILGKVESIQSYPSHLTMTVVVPQDHSGYATSLGESIAVNGCCLTVTSFDSYSISFDLSPETISKTSLSRLAPGSFVNLERALRLGDRLGGHLVSGHVDGLGKILTLEKTASCWDLDVSIPRDLSRYLIKKGSITVDGVSLTINDLVDREETSTIRLTLIPATIQQTNFQFASPADAVNIEVDILGKYLERLQKRP